MKQFWNYSIINVCFSQSADAVHWVYYATLSQLRPNTGPFPVINLLYCLSAFFNQTKKPHFSLTIHSTRALAELEAPGITGVPLLPLLCLWGAPLTLKHDVIP